MAPPRWVGWTVDPSEGVRGVGEAHICTPRSVGRMVDPSMGVRGVGVYNQVVTYLASLKSYKKLQRKWNNRICQTKGEVSGARRIMDMRKWNNLKKLKLQTL